MLSGGYARFFSRAPQYGYGAVSFYQPLYLYWDWIAANNPFHYVGALAGDGKWSDPTHWVTNLDPNYQVITGGQLVNGIPTSPGAGKGGTTGQFGQICFQNRTSSDCLDTASGIETVNGNPIGTASNDKGNALVSAVADTGDGTVTAETTRRNLIDAKAAQAAGATFVDLALPAATLTNGLPGATNFVPNNADGIRTTGVIGRYFDVTLGATGTTTLDYGVAIDRLTMTASGARLNITGTGSLTSLIDVTQLAGVMNVDGTLRSTGDYLLMGGGLTGSGTIFTPFLTNVTGTIAPGGDRTIGTLTIGGNAVLSSGSALMIDLGSNRASDLLAVNATTFDAAGKPSDGTANLGGRVMFYRATGQRPRANDVFTFLTAQGGITNTFFTPTALSAILTPTLLYSANAVQVRLDAARYTSVINNASSVQYGYATLLDQNRGNAALFGVYDTLDFLSAADIQSTLEALAPRTETLKSSLAIAATDNISRLLRERIGTIDTQDMGGRVAYLGTPMQSAVAALVQPGVARSSADVTGAVNVVQEGRLPESMSAFVAGGYLKGNSLPMQGTLNSGGRDRFDGYYIAAGIEHAFDDDAAIGFALSYTDLKGTTAFGGQSASGKLYQGSLYGKFQRGPLLIDTLHSAGLFAMRGTRSAAIGTDAFTLTSREDALAVSSEVGAGLMFGDAIQIGPRVAMRASHLGFSKSVESGGIAALGIDRSDFNSVQSRAGVVLKSNGGAFRPYASATYVHDFLRHPAAFGANFAGGIGPNAIFALGGQDRDWYEVAGGVTFSTGNVDFSAGADTTIDRFDVRNESYRGSVTFHF